MAGSAVAYDGLQLRAAQLLGVSSGERYMQWRYDDRSRLLASLAGVAPDNDPLAPAPGRVLEQLTPSDYRLAQERLSQFDAATAAALTSKGIDTSTVDPPSSYFDRRPGGGHKIDRFTQGQENRPFGWDGAERVDDGRFVYEFDAKGRLVRATEKTLGPPTRRITYIYSGPGRLAGRRAEYTLASSPQDDDWRLEDRKAALDADGLPAETTFIFDPISDHLVATYDASGAPLRQVIHGGAAYDDPIETTTRDANGNVIRLYPVYDEAGAGSLQAVLNTSGKIVARSLQTEAYGAETADFGGPAIDDISISIAKDSSGVIAEVKVRIHATERLDPSTIAAGSRLSTVDATGVVIRTTSTPATLASDDPFALEWTLTASEWSSLLSSAPPATPTALSIAITNHLRATTWPADTPILPPPTWATATYPIHTSATLPVELRHPLATLTSLITTTPATTTQTSTIYAIENLPLATEGKGGWFIENVGSAGFQALPYWEGATGLVYVRNRWFDPGTGTWLSPDPLGYTDSSNLY
ncbi:MAG TPA: hypothetical protein VEB19_06250, partial [Gemmatimonadaceae bacterium]|nr:hypothetical protein [Gemmatimonadaceae bacterium]